MSAANSNKPVIEMTVRLDGREIVLPGREAFAMDALIHRGETGVTALEWVGYRWSGYVFKLRNRGFVIETVHETHGGPFAGRHARYVLHSPVEVVRIVREGEKTSAAA